MAPSEVVRLLMGQWVQASSPWLALKVPDGQPGREDKESHWGKRMRIQRGPCSLMERTRSIAKGRVASQRGHAVSWRGHMLLLPGNPISRSSWGSPVSNMAVLCQESSRLPGLLSLKLSVHSAGVPGNSFSPAPGGLATASRIYPDLV